MMSLARNLINKRNILDLALVVIFIGVINFLYTTHRGGGKPAVGGTLVAKMHPLSVDETSIRQRLIHTWSGKEAQVKTAKKIGAYSGFQEVQLALCPQSDVTLELKDLSEELIVGGKMAIRYNNEDGTRASDQTFEVEAFFVDNKIIHIYCNNTNKISIQYGVLMLELDSTGTKLAGTYSFFGPVMEAPVCGFMQLRR